MKGIRCTALLSLFLLCACIGERGYYTPEFLTDETLRMEDGKKEIIRFSPYSCQYAYNPERGEFRLYKDNLSSAFQVILDEIPTQEGQIVNASSLTWMGETSSRKQKKDIALEAVKLEGDVIWLWSSSENLKMTVRLR